MKNIEISCVTMKKNKGVYIYVHKRIYPRRTASNVVKLIIFYRYPKIWYYKFTIQLIIVNNVYMAWISRCRCEMCMKL